MLERQHLEILDILRREGTLARVADELHLTQPTITHAIRKLEGELGVSLWRRRGRGVELTQAGDLLAHRSARILADLRRTESDLIGVATGRRGTLRIGVECHPCFHWLSGIVGEFLNRWPDVDVDVIRGYQFAGYDALLDHQIDVVVTPDPRHDDRLVSVEVLPYELLLAIGSGHKLATRRSIKPADLVGQTLYTYPVDPGRLDVFTEFLDPAGIAPRSVVAIETTEIMVQLVAAGRGVCTLPDWLLEENREADALTGIRIGAQGIKKALVVSYRREDAGIGYLEDFATTAERGRRSARARAVSRRGRPITAEA